MNNQNNYKTIGGMLVSSSEPNPQAFISSKKARLKMYNTSLSNQTIYLKDAQNYEIELYNPMSTKVAASISIDGKSIGNMIVLKPGQRIFLERWLDTNNKFVFETYNVEKTQQNIQAISKSENGKITVEWFKEWSFTPFNTVMYGTYITEPAPYFNPQYGTITCNSTNMVPVSKSFSNLNSLSSGTSGKGEASKQNFSVTSGDFSQYISIDEFLLLPIQNNVVEAVKIRNYCTGCGTRVKDGGWKFCPSCGTQI